MAIPTIVVATSTIAAPFHKPPKATTQGAQGSDPPSASALEVQHTSSIPNSPKTSNYDASDESSAPSLLSSPSPSPPPLPKRRPPSRPVRTEPAPTYAPPPTRQTTILDHPYGVVSGAAIIDMATHLSRTRLPSDWALSAWLRQHYIEPFNRIERLDGIVVADADNMCVLLWAHQNYAVVDPMPLRFLPPQALWVPGLEPREESMRGDVQVLEPVWGKTSAERDVFDAADMFARGGERRGEFVGRFEDGLGWQREMWRLPGAVESVV